MNTTVNIAPETVATSTPRSPRSAPSIAPITTSPIPNSPTDIGGLHRPRRQFRRWTAWPTPLRWSGSRLQATSPRFSRSSPAPLATGSTARQSASTAESTSSTSPTPQTPTTSTLGEPQLESEELTILTSWAEAIAEVLASAPEQLQRTLAEAAGGATWRAGLASGELSPRLTETVDAMRRLLTSDRPADVEKALDRALAVVRRDPPGAQGRGGARTRARFYVKGGSLFAGF